MTPNSRAGMKASRLSSSGSFSKEARWKVEAAPRATEAGGKGKRGGVGGGRLSLSVFLPIWPLSYMCL